MEKELKNLEEKLKTVNAIVSKLDPAIKLAAFDLLKPFVFGKNIATQGENTSSSDDKKIQPPSNGDVRDFYASFDPKNPADSALVLAGWFYTERGSAGFTLEELRTLFDEVGVSCPARLDMTLKGSQRKGKTLFQNAGHGSYRPTVYGENHFKAEMNLRPGKKA